MSTDNSSEKARLRRILDNNVSTDNSSGKARLRRILDNNVSTDNSSGKARLWRILDNTIAQVIGGVIVIVALGGFVGLLVGRGGSPTPSQPSAGRGSTSTSPTASRLSTTYLDSLPRSSGDATLGVVNASGTKFSHGVELGTALTFPNSPRVVSFNLPAGFDSFRATLGVDPALATGFTGSFGVRVLAGNHQIVNTVVSSGSPPCGIDASIDRASTLVIQTYLNSGEPMGVVFGDARVVAGADVSRKQKPSACP